jgi:hypothetical protein
MYDILTATQGIVLLITILGCIPYGIWIIYSLFKKRWKRVAIQVSIPIAVYACLAGISALCSSKIHADNLTGLYDAEVKLGPAIFEYDSERAFNGDGYSFSVYELPPAIRKRFESADDSLLSEYPKHPSYRNHWKFEHWREAPLDDKFNEHLDFALSNYDSGNASGLSLHFESIRKALARKGSYYAFFYNNPGGYIGDIDFFIVDLVEGRLYSINHNT